MYVGFNHNLNFVNIQLDLKKLKQETVKVN